MRTCLPPLGLRSPATLLTSLGLLLLAALDLPAQQPAPAESRYREYIANLPANSATKFANEVMPKLVEAESNDKVFSEALDLYIDWWRELELQGFETSDRSNELALASLAKAYRTAALARGKYCFERKDPSEVAIVEGILSQAENLGLKTDMTAEDLEQLISKCLRFELVFTSEINLVIPRGDERSAVKTVVPLQVASDTASLPVLRGTAPIEISYYLRMPPMQLPCPIVTSTQSGQATVHRLKYDVKRDSATAPGKFTEVELWFDPGRPTETVSICGNDDTKSRWFTFFRMLHLAEYSADQNLFIIKDWKVSGTGEVFATKEIIEPTDSAVARVGDAVKAVKGRTRFELRHKPVWP